MITTSVIVRRVIGDFSCRIVADDDFTNQFLVCLPSPEDVDRFHGHGWYWWGEHVSFRCVLRVAEMSACNVFNSGATVQWY